MKFSLNDTFIVAPYQQGQGLKSNVKSGFAYIAQKQNLEPLKLLVDAKIDGQWVVAGSTIYVSEEVLTTMDWAKRIKTSPLTNGQEFIIIEKRYVSAIDTDTERS